MCIYIYMYVCYVDYKRAFTCLFYTFLFCFYHFNPKDKTIFFVTQFYKKTQK